MFKEKKFKTLIDILFRKETKDEIIDCEDSSQRRISSLYPQINCNKNLIVKVKLCDNNI